jgi:hypothetical protein
VSLGFQFCKFQFLFCKLRFFCFFVSFAFAFSVSFGFAEAIHHFFFILPLSQVTLSIFGTSQVQVMRMKAKQGMKSSQCPFMV